MASRSKRKRPRLDEATRIARAILPLTQANRGGFKVVDIANRSDADQRHMVRSGEKRTIRRLTHVERIRQKLVQRLKRKGQNLPGCDINGKRHTMKDHARHITAEQKSKFRELILGRMPVKRAAQVCGIGGCSAYRLRDLIKAGLGAAFPAPKLPGRVSKMRAEMLYAQAIPVEQLWRFRTLVREHGDQEARRIREVRA